MGKLKQLIRQELHEAGITKGFQAAVEKFREETINLQQLRAEQDQLVSKFKKSSSKEKEKLKKDLIAMHKKVQKQQKDTTAAERKFNKALIDEPEDLELDESTKLMSENLRKGDETSYKGNEARVQKRYKHQGEWVYDLKVYRSGRWEKELKVDPDSLDESIINEERKAKKDWWKKVDKKNLPKIKNAAKEGGRWVIEVEKPNSSNYLIGLGKTKKMAYEDALSKAYQSDVNGWLNEFGRISSEWVAVEDDKIIRTFPGYKEASLWFAKNKKAGVSIKSKKDHNRSNGVNESIKLKDVGKKDSWGRPIYKDSKGKIYKDIELGKGKNGPDIHTTTKSGEPNSRVKDFVIESNLNENAHEIAKITHGGDEWYMKKIDGTHVMSANNLSAIDKNRGAVLHVRQLSDRPYYNDVRKWLYGKKDIDGNVYESTNAIVENFSKRDMSAIETIMNDVNGRLAKLRDPLKKAGFTNIDFSFQPIPHFNIRKGRKRLIILNKKYADDAEIEVGNLAAGIMESTQYNEAFEIETPSGCASCDEMNESDKIDQFRDIVKSKSMKKVDGINVDTTTANMILQVYDKVNASTKQKLDKLRTDKLIDVVWKISSK